MSCFPNVKKKDFLRSHQIESDEEKLKFVLTKQELEDREFKWMKHLALVSKNSDSCANGKNVKNF